MTLISPAQLREADPGTVRVLDVRWALAEPDGRAAYERGHVPGAVYVDLETELSDHSVPGRGRHPLPSGADLQTALRRWGVHTGDTVVVYDDWNRAGSARAWWLLRAAGLTDVRILDGGWAAWQTGGGEVETGTPDVLPGDVTLPHPDLYAGALPTLTERDLAGIVERGTLLDARAPERFRGEVEPVDPVDPVAGHVPGAANVPSTSLLTADGRFVGADIVRARLGGLDAGVVGTYCGSGVTAAVVVAAAAHAGIDVALFPGSWSQWSSNPENPVELGDPAA